MSEDTRQLAAIMLTDVVGYTAMTQADEALTLALLEEHSALVRPLFAEHGGRVVKGTGDGFLVEFQSALQAVRCAVEIQRTLHERNASVPIDRAIHLRIGVHLGDVVHRGGDIFGDGVNITARIEPLAQPGGICLSRQVYDQVWNKVDLRMASLGKKDLKNVKVQIEVYRMLLPWVVAPAEAEPTSDRLRLAVLPLVNISPDPADEYFADGLTEELIYTLAKVAGLQVVIALTSVMAYRGVKKSVSTIGEELHVGTVLEGSVRKAGNRLRITLQLIEVAGEAHLWTEAYDRTLDDVFAVQSDVAQHVAQALELKLLPRTKPARPEQAVGHPGAYAAYLKGRALLAKRTEASIRQAIHSFEEAVELDPASAEAFAALSAAYGILTNYVSSAPANTLAKAKDAAWRALQLDKDLPEAHAALAVALIGEMKWAEAERELRQAVELSPSYATAYHWLGLHLLGLGRLDEAIEAAKRAVALDPLSPVQHGALGQIYFVAGKDDLALEEFEMHVALGEENVAAATLRGEIRLRQGNAQLALADFERAREIVGGVDPYVELCLARAREALGEKGALETSLAGMIERSKQLRVSPYTLALYHFLLGRNDEGFVFLETAREERDVGLEMVKVDPALASCRLDPRYAAFLRKVGLGD